MYFPLFLPLRAETRESFYSLPTTLFSNLAELRFLCSVSVDIHGDTDVAVSQKLLYILGAAPFASRLLVKVWRSIRKWKTTPMCRHL